MVNDTVKADVCVICIVRATVVFVGRSALLIVGKRILECLMITIRGMSINGYFVFLDQILDSVL